MIKQNKSLPLVSEKCKIIYRWSERDVKRPTIQNITIDGISRYKQAITADHFEKCKL